MNECDHAWWVCAIEYRPALDRGPMTPAELAKLDQLLAAGDLGETGSWLLDQGFEFRLDLGAEYMHVSPGRV